MSKFSKRTMPLITEEEIWDLLDFSYVTVRKIRLPRADLNETKITVRKTEPWTKLDQSKVTVRVREPLIEIK